MRRNAIAERCVPVCNGIFFSIRKKEFTIP